MSAFHGTYRHHHCIIWIMLQHKNYRSQFPGFFKLWLTQIRVRMTNLWPKYERCAELETTNVPNVWINVGTEKITFETQILISEFCRSVNLTREQSLTTIDNRSQLLITVATIIGRYDFSAVFSNLQTNISQRSSVRFQHMTTFRKACEV